MSFIFIKIALDNQGRIYSSNLDVEDQKIVPNQDELALYIPKWAEKKLEDVLPNLIAKYRKESFTMRCARLLGLKGTRVQLLANEVAQKINEVKEIEERDQIVIVKDMRCLPKPSAVWTSLVGGSSLATFLAWRLLCK